MHVFVYEGRDPKVQLDVDQSRAGCRLTIMDSECLAGNGLKDLNKPSVGKAG